jgi:phage terminase large subunit
MLKEVRFGVDFGWTNPTAILAVGYDGDDRVWVLDEVYQRHMGKEAITQALVEFKQKYGAGPIFCDPSNPETINAVRQAELYAVGYEGKREDGIRELGARFLKAGDGSPRLFISKKCVNLISELLEYREDVKENDHAVDALRYSLKSAQAPPGVGAVMLPHQR